MRFTLAIGLIVGWSAALSALAQEGRALQLPLPAGTVACDVEVYTDKASVNVRVAPRSDAAIVGTLQYDDGGGINLVALGSQNGWFLVDPIAKEREGWRFLPRNPYPGLGWVHRSQLAIEPRSNRLRAAPSDTAAVIVRRP